MKGSDGILSAEIELLEYFRRLKFPRKGLQEHDAL